MVLRIGIVIDGHDPETRGDVALGAAEVILTGHQTAHEFTEAFIELLDRALEQYQRELRELRPTRKRRQHE